MSYLTQSRMASDGDLYRRVVACAAQERVTGPDVWVTQRLWQFSAQPGWVPAYASAIEAHKTGGTPSRRERSRDH